MRTLFAAALFMFGFLALPAGADSRVALTASTPAPHAALPVLSPPGGPSRTEKVSVAYDGSELPGLSSGGAASADGRFVAFVSASSNVVAGTGYINQSQVYVRDRVLGTNQLISKTVGGTPGTALSAGARISADGRYVTFVSDEANLLADPVPGLRHLYSFDRVNLLMERIDVDNDGQTFAGAPTGFSAPALSDDGRYVTFSSGQSSLVAGDSNDVSDVFLRDRATGTTSLISRAPNGQSANGESWGPSISADGHRIAYESPASNLVAADTNNARDVFVFDVMTGSTTRASVGESGAQADSWSHMAAISGDGTHVAFVSNATNLVALGDHNGREDEYLRDLSAGTTMRVTVAYNGGEPATNYCCAEVGQPAISFDGRFVAFPSFFGNLVPGDDTSSHDAFVRDTVALTTELVTVTRGTWHSASISIDGRYVVMGVGTSNLYDDLWGYTDTWIRDRCGTPAFSTDSDSDGMPNCFEAIHPCLNAAVADSSADPDGDGMSSLGEMQGTSNPCAVDTDRDGMSDSYEVAHACLYPDFNDAARDKDSDHLMNLAESTRAMDPCSADTDADTMPDEYEFNNGCLDPVVADSSLDYDADALSNLQEYAANIDPCDADMDQDGLPDGYEFGHSACLNPRYVEYSDDPDGDGLPSLFEYLYGTNPCILDTDGDLVADGFVGYGSILSGPDNCPLVANADQANTDRNFIDLHVFGMLFDDITVVNSDTTGDACDGDIDNDGLPNDVEAEVGPAGSEHAFCATATGPTNPLLNDTDDDLVLDWAECDMGTDPVNAASKPPVAPLGASLLGDTDHDGLTDAFEAIIGTNPAMPDTDGDKLLDSVEFKGYASNPLVVDTDGDVCPDGREAASVNADVHVNSLDMLAVASHFGPRTSGKYIKNFDVNKDGNINSIDMLIQAKLFTSLPC